MQTFPIQHHEPLSQQQKVHSRRSVPVRALLLFESHDLSTHSVHIFEQRQILSLHKSKLSHRAEFLAIGYDLVGRAGVPTDDVHPQTLYSGVLGVGSSEGTNARLANSGCATYNDGHQGMILDEFGIFGSNGRERDHCLVLGGSVNVKSRQDV